MYKKEIWHVIPGLKIHWQDANYGVLNERAVRATAGITFAIWFFTMLTTYYTKTYFLLYGVVTFFFIDFLIKVLWGPKYSLLSRLWSFLVRKQDPEWVWAIQKRFAWGIGLFMSFLVMNISIVFHVRGMLPLSLCSVCLLFMWMESSLWVCVWCNIYSFLEWKGMIKKKDIRPACPGGVCRVPQVKK
jgi:hypothetical protein